jgi:transmembrane sensor
MSEISPRVRAASQQLGVNWSPAHMSALARATQRRLVRRSRIRFAAASAAAALVLGAAAWFQFRPTASSQLLAVNEVEAHRVSVRADGSVESHGDAALRTVRLDSTETTFELERGVARFSVEAQKNRTVRVGSGHVTVQVIGTQFLMERIDNTVRVSVESGVVQVSVDGLLVDTLLAQQSRTYADVPGRVAPTSEASAEEEVVPHEADDEVEEADAPELDEEKKATPARKHRARKIKKVKAVTTGSEWRSLADKGSFVDAWVALKDTAPRDEPEDLLKAADVARLSGHPSQALAPLRRITTRFQSDSRAALAAFTLGRVLLEDLRVPAEAADAFALSRSLAPNGALAGDALAREVEAWSRARKLDNAKQKATQYLERYPSGPHVSSVLSWAQMKRAE